jgi:hypothetical protein
MKIAFGHGRWDISYDRDLSTDDRVQWTNVGTEDLTVLLVLPGMTVDAIPFLIEAGESYVGYTGSVLRVAE